MPLPPYHFSPCSPFPERPEDSRTNDVTLQLDLPFFTDPFWFPCSHPITWLADIVRIRYIVAIISLWSGFGYPSRGT